MGFLHHQRRWRMTRRQQKVLLWALGVGTFLLCWLLLTLLILMAQEALLGPLLLLGQGPAASGTVEPDSYAGRGIQLLVGHFNGNLPAERAANLSSEEVNANHYSPQSGAGEQGRPVELAPREEARAERTFGINQFNLVASDSIALNRSLPDVRRPQCRTKHLPPIQKLPDTSVIVVFHNEAFSTLARTITSVVNRSPSILLRELILVDDFSNRKFLGTELENFLRTLSVPSKLLRAHQRVGLIRARLMGAQEATGVVLTFLDSHCECTEGWLEPLLARIWEEPRAVVCPIIDVINDRSFAYQKGIELFRGGFNWNLQFRWYSVPSALARQRHRKDPTAPIPSPTMAGGLFSIGRRFFLELGEYDSGMDIWGGENLEMSFRVWQCGGRVEILPCSHVGHVFRHASPHDFPLGSSSGRVLNANLARVSEVWMAEWRHFFHKVTPQALALVPSLDVSERVELRKQLGCRDFGWYLENVWPDHFLPSPHSNFGRFRHIASQSCLISRPSAAGKRHRLGLGPCSLGFDLWQFWVLTPHGENGLRLMSDEHQCLSAAQEQGGQPTAGSWRVQLRECGGHDMEFWRLDHWNAHFVHLKSGLCLDEPALDPSFADDPEDIAAADGHIQNRAKLPTMGRCGRSRHSQKWEMQQIPWQPQNTQNR